MIINTLSLTRREKQTLTIDDPFVRNSAIKVEVLAVRGDQVKLRVSKPCGTGVDRQDVWVEKKPAASEGTTTMRTTRKPRMSKAQATVVAVLCMIGLLAGMFLYAKYCFIPVWQHQIDASYKIETNK